MADKSLGLRPSWKEIWDFGLKWKRNRFHLSCFLVTRLIHDFTLYLLLFFASLSFCCVRWISFVLIHFLLWGHSFSFLPLKLNISHFYRYRCLYINLPPVTGPGALLQYSVAKLSLGLPCVMVILDPLSSNPALTLLWIAVQRLTKMQFLLG